MKDTRKALWAWELSQEQVDAIGVTVKNMRTKYCPHCCSEKIHRIEEDDGSHFHECSECDETWEHHESTEKVAEKSNN